MQFPEEFSIITKDGLKLMGQEWSVIDPKAAVCIVHGLGEHIGRYQHVADYFLSQQVAVFGIDLRGHGLSEGKRGHTVSYEAFMEDIELFLMYARAEFNDVPIFLFGHSLGGQLVSNYVLKNNINELNGAIISSPWLRLAVEPPKWQKKMAHLIAKILPRLTQSNAIAVNCLTHDEGVNEAYQVDPLVHDKISTRMFVECYREGFFPLNNAELNKLPLLIYHGDQDQITSATASKEFSESAAGDVTFHLFPETKHESHNDLKKGQVLNLVQWWMSERY